MKKVLQFLVFAFLINSAAAGNHPDIRSQKSLINFYRVELVCPAAPHIGCGSASKPLLLTLERDQFVAEAWLNRKGTVLAVMWKEKVGVGARLKLVKSVLEQKNVREIKGNAREQTLRDFETRVDWYRGAEVDKLSEEEAAIMAARLVRRMQKLVTFSDEKGRALQRDFGHILADKLSKKQTQEETEKQILKTCRDHLDEKAIAVLQKANEEGAFSNLRND